MKKRKIKEGWIEKEMQKVAGKVAGNWLNRQAKKAIKDALQEGKFYNFKIKNNEDLAKGG